MEDSLGFCFTLELVQEPVPCNPRLLTVADEPLMEVSTASAMRLQHVRAALATWRSRNTWAHAIQFEDFPEKYKNTIKLAAYINQHKEEQL
jgi:hypothetical protein